MTSSPGFAYAQARLQARHGARLGAGDWSQLHTSRDLSHFLDAARRTTLAPWLQHLDARSDAHAIGRALARELRDHIDTVATWVPARWQPPVQWTRWLVDLPVLRLLLEDGPPPPWATGDPVLQPFAGADLGTRRTAMAGAGLAPLFASSAADGAALRRAWRARWEALVPSIPPSRRGEVLAFADGIDRHLAAMRGAPRDADGWLLRADLESYLERVVRRAAVHPIAVFAHLALTAIDLERLRGALLRRALFPDLVVEASWV